MIFTFYREAQQHTREENLIYTGEASLLCSPPSAVHGIESAREIPGIYIFLDAEQRWNRFINIDHFATVCGGGGSCKSRLDDYK